MKCRITKKLLIVCFCTLLVFTNNVVVPAQTAYATGLEAVLIPLAAGAGITVGGAIIILLGITALGLGAEFVIDNWDDIVQAFNTWTDTTGGSIKDWLAALTASAVIQDYNNDGVISSFDKVISGKLNIPSDVKSQAEAFLENYLDCPDGLEVGEHNWQNDTPEYARILEAQTLYSRYKSNYPYMIVMKTMYVNAPYDYACFIATTPFMIGMDGTHPILRTVEGSFMYRYVEPTKKFTDYTTFTYYPVTATWSAMVSDYKDIIYTNNNVYNMVKDYSGNWQKSTLNKATSKEYNYTIDTSAYKNTTNDLTRTQDTAITITPELVGEMSKIDGATLTDTDTIVKAITTADEASEANYRDVISTDIVQPVEKAGWLDGLLDGLKDVLDWLFVPADGIVEAKTEELTAKVNSQMGILSYPVALVIKFLMGVSELTVTDCILRIPKIEFKGQVFYPGIDYNLSASLREPQFATIYSYYKLITDFILIIAVVNLAIKKGDEIISPAV